jgi:hypothetical protein
MVGNEGMYPMHHRRIFVIGTINPEMHYRNGSTLDTTGFKSHIALEF